MPLTITPKNTAGFEIEDKRFHIPFVFSSPCPSCGEVHERDLSGGDYLAYPKLGKTKCGFYCEDCDKDWSESFILGITAVIP